ELVDAGACAGLDQLPRAAAELGKGGSARVRTDVSRDLADLLVRDVQPVVPLEGELEVVPRDLGHGAGLEAEQLPDAVILVDDVVACSELGEGLQRAAEMRGRPRRSLAEDLGVGQQDEPELAPDEAAARRGDGEEELWLARELVRLEDARVDPPQQVLRAERLTAVREGDDDPVAVADEALQL